MNELFYNKIKFPLEVVEFEQLMAWLGNDYENLKQRINSIENCKDLLIGVELLLPIKKKYVSIKITEEMFGIKNLKPYNVRATKVQLIWLYDYIDKNKIAALRNLQVNIIGKHIIQYIQK